MIPLTLKLRIKKKNGKIFNLWFPTFLIWLLLLPLFILLAPLVLIVSLLLWQSGKGKPLLESFFMFSGLIF